MVHTHCLLKNFISNSKVASGKIFNKFFKKVSIKHKIFRKFTLVGYAIVDDRYLYVETDLATFFDN